LAGLGLPWNKKPTIGNGIGGRIPLKGGRFLYVDKNGNICPQNSYMGSSKQTRMQEQQWLKTMKSNHGKFELDVPRDRNGSFEPQIVKKNQTTMTDEIEKKRDRKINCVNHFQPI